MSIRMRMVTIIALTVILAVSAGTAVVMKVQKANMTASEISQTGVLCNVIEKAEEGAMSEGRPGDLRKIAELIGGRKEITRLRILSPEGMVLNSVDSSEIGSRPAALKASVLAASGAAPVFVKGSVIDYFRDIPNRKECFRCHSSSQKILGIIQMTREDPGSYIAFLSLKRVLFVFCLAIVLLVLMTTSSLFSRMVVKPLKNLRSAMGESEAGNWNARADLEGSHEIGELGRSFNKMVSRVNALRNRDHHKEGALTNTGIDAGDGIEVRRPGSQPGTAAGRPASADDEITPSHDETSSKKVELELAVDILKKINQMGRTLSSVVETDEVMRIIVHTAADLFRAEKVTMHIRGEACPTVTMQYIKGRGISRLVDLPPELKRAYPDFFGPYRRVPVTQAVSGKAGEGLEKNEIGVPLEVKGQVVGAIILEGDAYFKEDRPEILATLSNQAMASIENTLLYQSVKKNYFSTIQSLVNALEANDRFTKGHSERVRVLSLELGKYLGLKLKELELLEHAAILHDIGKIGIDNFVLQKQGKLTAGEYGLVKTHPLIGDEILGPIENLEGVRETIIQHHERYDGMGYPYGLRGEEITQNARILAVVDTFDAMMTDRPYRKALDMERVMDELRSHAGTQFDPALVQAFMDMLESRGEGFLPKAGYNDLLSI